MTVEQLEKDIKFLAKRAGNANCISFDDTKRDRGDSSNSIVSIAYGIIELKEQVLPFNLSDLLSCERMWRKLPKHRKTGQAVIAMNRARTCDYRGKEIFNKNLI